MKRWHAGTLARKPRRHESTLARRPRWHADTYGTRFSKVYDLYGWAMSQKFPVNNSERIEDAFQFDEDLIKIYNEESHEGRSIS